MSISDGFIKAIERSIGIDANTFQYFTRNPRGGQAKDLDIKEIEKLQKIMKSNNFAPLFAHAAYTMNLASDKEHVRNFARMILKDDLERVEIIGNTYYLFHPGSHVGQGVEKGTEYIVEALNDIIPENNETIIMLETMSGKGTEIGRSFEEIKTIIDKVEHNEKLGVCLDTCHMYSAGYDIVNNLDEVVEELDDIIGLDRVYGIHLNDSKMEFNSNKDRHEVIGEGTIGLEAIVNFINHEAFKNLVFNLETPNELDGFKEEIKLLRANYEK